MDHGCHNCNIEFEMRLCIAAILKSVAGGCVVLLGMKCSSWTVVNMGTSKRSPCCPAGDQTNVNVGNANCMAARTGYSICMFSNFVINLFFMNPMFSHFEGCYGVSAGGIFHHIPCYLQSHQDHSSLPSHDGHRQCVGCIA